MRGVTSGQSYKSISALLPSSCDITDVIYVRWARKISPGQQVRRIQRDFARLTVYRSLIGSPVSMLYGSSGDMTLTSVYYTIHWLSIACLHSICPLLCWQMTDIHSHAYKSYLYLKYFSHINFCRSVHLLCNNYSITIYPKKPATEISKKVQGPTYTFYYQ